MSVLVMAQTNVKASDGPLVHIELLGEGCERSKKCSFFHDDFMRPWFSYICRTSTGQYRCLRQSAGTSASP